MTSTLAAAISSRSFSRRRSFSAFTFANARSIRPAKSSSVGSQAGSARLMCGVAMTRGYESRSRRSTHVRSAAHHCACRGSMGRSPRAACTALHLLARSRHHGHELNRGQEEAAPTATPPDAAIGASRRGATLAPDPPRSAGGVEWDDHFAFIAGFTEGGCPFGTTWWEVEQGREPAVARAWDSVEKDELLDADATACEPPDVDGSGHDTVVDEEDKESADGSDDDVPF